MPDDIYIIYWDLVVSVVILLFNGHYFFWIYHRKSTFLQKSNINLDFLRVKKVVVRYGGVTHPRHINFNDTSIIYCSRSQTEHKSIESMVVQACSPYHFHLLYL